jgi:hypothetical protein
MCPQCRPSDTPLSQRSGIPRKACSSLARLPCHTHCLPNCSHRRSQTSSFQCGFALLSWYCCCCCAFVCLRVQLHRKAMLACTTAAQPACVFMWGGLRGCNHAAADLRLIVIPRASELIAKLAVVREPATSCPTYRPATVPRPAHCWKYDA